MSDPSGPPAEVRFQHYLVANARASSHVVEIGPFVAQFDADDPNPFRNYATPRPGAAPTDADIRALADAFQARARRPRLEYVEAVFPMLAERLAPFAFGSEGTIALMGSYVPPLARDPAADFVFKLCTVRDAFGHAARVQNEAYDGGPVTEADVDRLSRVVEGGGIVGLILERSTGEPASSGLCTPPRAGVTELAAVATRPAFRGRGLAGALTFALAEAMRVDRSAEVFLMAFPEEQPIYERVGFTVISAIANISVGSDSPEAGA